MAANINIDRLEIRLKGISPQMARSVAAGLGHELLKQLAKQQGLLQKKRAIQIEKMDSGTLKTKRNTSSPDLQRMVAARIANTIGSK